MLKIFTTFIWIPTGNSNLSAETSSGSAGALLIFHGECVKCVRQIVICMDKLKRSIVLLILSIVLAIAFAILFVSVNIDNRFLRLAVLAAFIFQLIQVFYMYFDVRKNKKGKDK